MLIKTEESAYQTQNEYSINLQTRERDKQTKIYKNQADFQGQQQVRG